MQLALSYHLYSLSISVIGQGVLLIGHELVNNKKVLQVVLFFNDIVSILRDKSLHFEGKPKSLNSSFKAQITWSVTLSSLTSTPRNASQLHCKLFTISSLTFHWSI